MRHEPLDLGTPLGRYPWIVLRLRCHVCERQADVRLTACVARYGYGVPLELVLRRFMAACPYVPFTELRKPQKYGHRCGAYLPDIHSRRPPDLPPSMSGLNLIEGRKADMLPAEPLRPDRRRRVGGD